MGVTVVSWPHSFSRVTPKVGTRDFRALMGSKGAGMGAWVPAWVTESWEKVHCEDEISTSHSGGWWLSLDKMEVLGGLR